MAGTARTVPRRIKAFALFKCIAFEKQLVIFSQNTLRPDHPPLPVVPISFLSEKKNTSAVLAEKLSQDWAT